MTRPPIFQPVINEIRQRPTVAESVEILLTDLYTKVEKAPTLEHAREIVRTAYELRAKFSESIAINAEVIPGPKPGVEPEPPLEQPLETSLSQLQSEPRTEVLEDVEPVPRTSILEEGVRPGEGRAQGLTPSQAREFNNPPPSPTAPKRRP